MSSLDDRIEFQRESLKNVRMVDAPSENDIPSSSDVNIPWIYRWAPISHYYGDTVRQFMIGGAAIMLLTAPFYTDNISAELPFIVFGTVALVAVSALTTPWKQGIMSMDAIASGVGLVIFELWAIQGYGEDEFHKFVLREALAIIFLFAFYFSTKTLRSMILREIGRRDPPAARTAHITTQDQESIPTPPQTKEALHELNDYEKLEYTD